ncbi:MAG TPA: DUF1963 domain-containing protein [Methylomirabilota bacterium]|nr:DUF1963 domain-containing protein [Methylomirabilota bacterium]
MEKASSKQHPEFDVEAMKRFYRPVTKKLSGEQIASPFDLYSVERLRDDHQLRKDPAFKTDVFVFGKGTPRKRHLTKVSGVPYWPTTRQWPRGENGERYQFLAQFNFADSTDLVPELPGDLLLIFVPQGDEDWWWENDLVKFEWLKIKDTPTISKIPAGVDPYSPSEWYGVIHRTHDYPVAAALGKKAGLAQSYNLGIVNGTKIGGLPHSIQKDEEQWGAESQTKFLCQLSSIQAAPHVPYPWTNHTDELSLEFDDGGIYGDDNQCIFGDMGLLNVFLDADGNCVVNSASY